MNYQETDKKFKYYTLQPPAEKKESSVNTGFFFIGHNSNKLTQLTNTFSAGYTTESLENAQSMLTKLLQHGKKYLPAIIICEPVFDMQSIKRFADRLRKDPNYSHIIFVLDGSDISKETLDQYRKARFVDDIIFLKAFDADSLMKKINFLKKTRTDNHQKPSLNKAANETLYRNNTIQTGIKRVFDVLISGAALIVLSPIFLLIALAIKLENRGPVFYISKRAGKGYRIFDFYKFRTMEVGSDVMITQLSAANLPKWSEGGPRFYKIQNDPRVTKVGSFLRKTSLDELPQLINVLLGDMSLVGNRPLPLYEAATLTTDEWAQRFMAPAGMTGLWQIRKSRNEMPAEHRINIDIEYSNKHNFFFDLWIIANTPSAIANGFKSGKNE